MRCCARAAPRVPPRRLSAAASGATAASRPRSWPALSRFAVVSRPPRIRERCTACGRPPFLPPAGARRCGASGTRPRAPSGHRADRHGRAYLGGVGARQQSQGGLEHVRACSALMRRSVSRSTTISARRYRPTRCFRRSSQLTWPRRWFGVSRFASTCCSVAAMLAFSALRSSGGVSLHSSRARA